MFRNAKLCEEFDIPYTMNTLLSHMKMAVDMVMKIVSIQYILYGTLEDN